jgi:hypothetical protein
MPSPLDDSVVERLKREARAIRSALESLDRELASRRLPSGPGGAPRTPVPSRPLPLDVDADGVRAALEALETEMRSFRAALDGARTETTVSTNTRDASGPASSPLADLRTSFGDFISSVGRSVADAQSDLDREARNHVVRSKGLGGPLFPTLYRIPKLSAEVKFAFEKQTGRRLNLLFFSKKENSSEEHQQSISFDIVAVPPPPELVERLESGVPAVRLVLEPRVRERIFMALRGAVSDKSDKPDKVGNLDSSDEKVLTETIGSGPDAIPAKADRVIILESVPNPNEEYVLVLASPDASNASSHQIGIWHMGMKHPVSLNTSLRFEQKNYSTTNQSPLRSLMAALGDQQAEVLAAADQPPTT